MTFSPRPGHLEEDLVYTVCWAPGDACGQSGRLSALRGTRFAPFAPVRVFNMEITRLNRPECPGGGLVHEVVAVWEDASGLECVWRLEASLGGPASHRPGMPAAGSLGVSLATENQQTGFPLGLLGGCGPPKSRTWPPCLPRFVLGFNFSHSCHLQRPPQFNLFKKTAYF